MKKIVYTLIAVVVLAIAGIFGISLYMLDYSLKPENRGQDIDSSYLFMFERYPYLESWVDSLEQGKFLKDTFMTGHDGTRLHAYYIYAPDTTDATAVIVHGYTDNAVRMFMIGHLYNKELGYNVLLPDLHYSGLSGGDHFQMGWNDRLDVLDWMDVANSIFGDSTQMVVHGISMGAATTMMVSGEEQKPFVRCFVEDCGYTSVWDEFAHELKGRFGLPEFPLLHVANWLCRVKYGWDFKEASAEKQVAKCNYPMLFIHGDKDDFVPTWMVYDVYDAKPMPKELWVVPGSEHALSYMDNIDAYVERVRTFTDKYIER